VPLAGLVQWGGAWDGDARRGDGLPWLGRLTPERYEPGELALALARRWCQIADA
jgi:hypothetical protein